MVIFNTVVSISTIIQHSELAGTFLLSIIKNILGHKNKRSFTAFKSLYIAFLLRKKTWGGGTLLIMVADRPFLGVLTFD